MLVYYLVGYSAVAALFYWRAYQTAPLMEEFETPNLTLWINPETPAETQEDVRKAA